MPTDRTVYKYHFKKGNKIVHTGITNDIDIREAEHRDEPGLSRGHIKQIGFRTTYDAALSWLQERKKNEQQTGRLAKSYVTWRSKLTEEEYQAICDNLHSGFVVRRQSMKISGYSERGVLNSLFYEIRYAKNGDKLLAQLVGKATFPFTKSKPPQSGKATVFVEQSLSDFGDSDAIILIQSDSTKCAIFVEAKVLERKRYWDFSKHLEDFKNGLKSKVDSSNIFAQIYYKQRFMEADMAELRKGIPFPKWSFPERSSKKTRKIGNNPVVVNTAEQIKKCDTKFYLMLIPTNDDHVKKFFKKELSSVNFKAEEVPGWNKSHIGYLTWATVESFCKQNSLTNTLDTFTRNGDQIYRKT